MDQGSFKMPLRNGLLFPGGSSYLFPSQGSPAEHSFTAQWQRMRGTSRPLFNARHHPAKEGTASSPTKPLRSGPGTISTVQPSRPAWHCPGNHQISLLQPRRDGASRLRHGSLGRKLLENRASPGTKPSGSQEGSRACVQAKGVMSLQGLQAGATQPGRVTGGL